MVTRMFKTEEEALNAAKRKLVELYPGCERKWLEASPPDSYSEEKWRVTVFVMDGSPPKGILVLNRGKSSIAGFDAWNKLVLRYNWPIRWVH